MLEETQLSEAQTAVKNCYKLSSDSQCLECEKDYILSNNKCVLSPGCRYLSVDEEKCNVCLEPYTIVDYNKCEKNPPCKTMIEGKSTSFNLYY